MKRLLPLVAVLLSGCFFEVNSLNPFYTESTRVTFPDVTGEWDITQETRTDVQRRITSTWVITGDGSYRARRYEESGPGDTVMVFFRVNDRLYCDWQDEGRRFHHLYQVTLTNKVLALGGLDGEWLTNAIARQEVNLPAPERDRQSNLVFTATSLQWNAFLGEHGTNASAFGESVVLQRSPTANFAPLRRK